jgi:hypothetical protein
MEEDKSCKNCANAWFDCRCNNYEDWILREEDKPQPYTYGQGIIIGFIFGSLTWILIGLIIWLVIK